MNTVATYRLVGLDAAGAAVHTFDIRALPLRPDDVLVVQLGPDVVLSEAEELRMRLALAERLPGQQVLIVSHGVTLLRLERVQEQ
jgi:sarcosine oxidase gamma subunit